MATRFERKQAKVIETIKKLVARIQKDEQSFCKRMDCTYDDPMAEYIIETDPAKMWGSSRDNKSHILAQLRFDGDTYEYFSYNGAFASKGHAALEGMLEKIGCSLDFEDHCAIDIFQEVA